MKYLFNHDSAESAYIVHDYPWGFRLKTDQRHWIETNKKLGDRHVIQTLNPKNGKWCNPKKSTYSPVLVFYIDETTGYLRSCGLGLWKTTEDCLKFMDNVGRENLKPEQIHQLNKIMALNKAMEGVKFECKVSSYGSVSLLDRSPENLAKMEAIEKEQEEHKKQQDNVLKYINHVASQEMAKLEGGSL